jgi:threonine/homoserine/homoserine lactone efflux protein
MAYFMLSIFISMAIFAFIGAVTPGPVNIIATSAGASFGFRLAFAHVLGATVAYTLIVFFVGIGLGSLLILIPEVAISIKYLGAGFLLYMAFKIARAPVLASNQNTSQAQAPTFLQGGLVQVLNPKAWLVSMSGVGLFVSANSPVSVYLIAFCAISFIACLSGVSIWAASGQVISQYLCGQNRQLGFNIIMASLLTGCVLFMFI